MGLFDRFRSVGRTAAGSSGNQAGASEQDALRLILEGNAIEEEGRIEEAMQRYEAAIRLAPTLARAHLNRGNMLLAMDDAEGALGAYATALVHNPDYAAAHYNMGNANIRSGRYEAALAAYRKAIGLRPDFADAEVALGYALEELGRDDEAMLHYQAALQLNPRYAGAAFNLERLLVQMGQRMFHNGRHAALESWTRLRIAEDPDAGFVWKILGTSLQMQGKDSLPAWQRAAELLPEDVEVHSNLGDALQSRGQLEGAVASYRRALEIQPDSIEAHNNLGVTLQDLGQLDDAVASYRRALKIKPDHAEVHNNLGVALKDLGQLDGALASTRRALEIKPDFTEAHYNLGNALKDLGRLNDAVASYRRTLTLKPDYAEAHNNLGIALIDLGQLDDAAASYRRALKIKPDYAEAHMNLGYVLKELGELNCALASTRRALEINPDYVEARNNLLFTYLLLANHPPAEMPAEARRFGELVARLAQPHMAWRNVPDPARCLRVGFVSGDLCNHPVGCFVEGVLAALASNASGRMELFAYPSHHRTDEVTERIKASCQGWHSAVGLSDESLAQRIREDGIDILIDLSGHTAHNRLPLFAWKPAPVQASWLGYLATTGVAAMDYLIADTWTLPAAEEANFTEKIWRLPETYLCFTPPDVEGVVSPLPALANAHVTFGCFNNLSKINDDVVALWARVMLAVPDSRLFLKTKQLREASVRKNVVDRFAAHGIDAERLILKDLVPRAEYLAPYQQVDIALDPFPYPGITTSVEALWMGVPVLTLAGESFLSRQGVGLLMNAGLPEWIATDPNDYVARAVSHAGDLQRLASLRSGLREQVLASPIFDAPRFAHHFEAALRGMWQKWCDQQQDRP